MKKLFYVGALSALLLTACGEDTKKEENKVTEVENSTGTPSEQTGQNTTEVPSEQTGQNTTGTSTKLDILNTTVSLKEAVAVFQSAHPEAQIHSVELESTTGNLHYEITGSDASHEYEMRIDASSKQVLTDNYEMERETEPLLDFTKIIDPADAIQTASSNPQVSGMTPTSWKLEAEYGAQNYSIKYQKNFSEIEVYVNASTGELLGVELDD